MEAQFNPKTIGILSLKQFDALPRTGKPKDNEWTVLSCIIKEQNSCFEVVSLGTGSKCIGKSKMCPKGTILNDCHAEVMCRRAFLKYLYSQMHECSIIFSFNKKNHKFILKPDIKFHFFSTHVPCGDAAIFPKKGLEDIGDIINSLVLEQDETPAKKVKTNEDIFRTGAKCIETDSKQDLKEKGKDFHIVGVVRTKPGRGDPTASVSCSDKLSKWCHLGLQGSLLMELLESPIYLSTFTTLSKTPFCEKALTRALFERIENLELILPYKRNYISIYAVDLEFAYSKNDNCQSCSSSIAWCNTPKERYLEVSVGGKKQGVTKKHLNSDKGRLKICKLELFRTFVDTLKQFDMNLNEEVDFNKLTYYKAKHFNIAYQKNWIIMKKKFSAWTYKDPKLLDFTIEYDYMYEKT